MPAKSLCYTTRFHHAFIYIHFPVHCEPPLSAERKIRRNCRHKFYPQPFLIPIFNFPHKRPTLAFTDKVGTHSPFGKRSHTRAYTPKQGVFQMGCYYYPRTVSHVSETLRGQGVERQTVPLLGLGRGHSRRTQRACGTAMRLYASLSRRRRGPAGLRDLFSFLSKLRLVCPVPDTSFGSPDAPACAVPVQAASQLVPFRLGVQVFAVETGRIFCYNFGKRVT